MKNLHRILMAATLAIQFVGANPSYADDDKEKTGITDKEILIGSCSALTGPIKQLGLRQIAGAKAFINRTNDEGGVNGRKIKLIAKDDAYEPEKAIECFNELITDHVFAAAFFVGTPTAVKHVRMSEVHGVPLLGLFTGAHMLEDPFHKTVISVRASYFEETKYAIDRLWIAGLRKVGIIYQSDAFGAAVRAGVDRALEQHHAQTIAQGSFLRNTVLVENAVKDVRAKNPDVVYLVGAYQALGEIVKQAHAINWHPVFVTVSFVGTEDFIKAGGKDADGTIVTQVVPPYTQTDLPTIKNYLSDLRKYSPNEEPTFASLEGYVDALVLVEGLKRAGRDLTRTKFLSAIEGIANKDVGLGKLRLSYSATRHKGFDAVYPTVVQNGKAVTLTNWKKRN